MSDRLEAIADRYKRQVAGRYRPLGPDELGKVPPGACHSSPKIDGELWLAELADGKASLFARGGRTLEAPPLLKGLAAAASKFGRSIVVAGELHMPRDGSRPRVGDVASALAARKFDRLAFHLFDVVEADGQAPPASYADRLAMLREAVPAGEQIRVVETESHEGTSGLAAQVSEWIDSGKAEGLIVRTAAGEIFKVKPSFTIDAAVIAFTVRATEPDQVRSVLLGLVRPDGLMRQLPWRSPAPRAPRDASASRMPEQLPPLEQRRDPVSLCAAAAGDRGHVQRSAVRGHQWRRDSAMGASARDRVVATGRGSGGGEPHSPRHDPGAGRQAG